MSPVKPILKWAGGKTQMLSQLLPRVPERYGTYIEPFFGGGALFFALRPQSAVVSDSNPELVNLYRQVSLHVNDVIDCLSCYRNEEDLYYDTRALDWRTLNPAQAAARTLFLNKTCFNGLYRVNRQGGFNVPFGRYKNPCICDEDALRAASEALAQVEIVCGDYLDVLSRYAKKGDFVFLDPPYVPVSKHADFKRYTANQFGEDDHRRLASEVKRLREMGCSVLLTNSAAPLVYELYGAYEHYVFDTKRHISCHGDSRRGQDVLVVA